MKRHKPIADVVLPRLRNTALLAFAAALIGIPVAIALGTIAGLWRDRPPDVIVSTAAITAMTLPEFVSSTLLILVFSAWLGWRSEEHTSELQSLMRTSYAVFCLKKKKHIK